VLLLSQPVAAQQGKCNCAHGAWTNELLGLPPTLSMCSAAILVLATQPTLTHLRYLLLAVPGTGNTWVHHRACRGILDHEDATNCMKLPDDEGNFCPDFAPVDEDGYVWCDCMNEFGHVRLSATEDECYRTEGLTDEQHAAYEAAGINVVDYDCECCTCQAMIYGVPKVGQPGKSCDAGSLDPDNTNCGDSVYILFAVACGLLCVAGAWKALQAKQEAEEEAAKAAKKKPTKKNDLKKSLSSDKNYKDNPL
jgi:hypothetical protein